MKTIAIMTMLALPLAASAQIPNGGFENLSGWHITEGPANLKLTEDGYQGYSALIWSSQGQSVTLESHENYPFGGAENPGGHASSIKAKTFSGVYRYENGSGNCGDATAVVLIFRYNSSGDPERLASGSDVLKPGDDYYNFDIDITEYAKITDDARVLISFKTGTGCDTGNCCFLSLDELRLGGSKPPHQRDGTLRTGPDGRK
jgi:hypothetical protein